MKDLVLVYENKTGKHFKPLNTLDVTKDVLKELEVKDNDDYIIVREFDVTVKEDEKPDKEGYYVADQLEYEIVENGLFIKRMGKAFHNFKSNKDLDVSKEIKKLEKQESMGETINDDKVSVE